MTFQVVVDWGGGTAYGSSLYGSGVYGGVASDLLDDVTSRVRRAQGRITAEYGRDQSTALAPTVSGRGSFILDNSDRRFSPRNTASPLYGSIRPARPVHITRTVAGVEYVVFDGHTDDSPINPDIDSRSVNLSLVDHLADFRGLTFSTALYASKRTGEAIEIILDEIGWTGSRDIDVGATVMPWWWEDNADALDALEKLVRCEGPPAQLSIGSDGGIIFRDRHHRLINPSSGTSQGTWRNVATVDEPVMTKPFIYDDAWRNIINTGLVSVGVRTVQPLETVWESNSPFGFLPNSTATFIVSTTDPFLNAVLPTVGTDYALYTGSIGFVNLSRTSGASTTITMTAGSGGAVINDLKLRAQPVRTAYTIQVAASNASSITDYGSRSYPGDLPFCGIHDAQAVLETAVRLRAQPLPIVQARFMVGTNERRAARILGRDLSDRVTVVETQTALNDDFYIESIAHDASSEHDHAVTFGLEMVPPAGDVTSSNVFIIGSNVSGHRIGEGKLAG